MSFFSNLADNTSEKSVSHRMRQKRFSLFFDLIQTLGKRELKILDIGGTYDFWQKMKKNGVGVDLNVTLLNLEKFDVPDPNFTSIIGDATNLSEFPNQSFDVVFSNSVIEHLFNWENQKKMASEVQRVGKNFFVQTPNYWFPIEPHWFFPFFQFLPKFLRIEMTHKLKLGFIGRIRNKEEAKKQVDEVRLLTGKEMKMLFPKATLWEEKFFGFTKSLVIHSFKNIS